MLSRRTMVASGLSVAGLGAVGYGLWPRLNRYNEEVTRQRQLLSADPELEDLVRMASLAANGHNTQPWKFRLGEGRVTILPDFTRRTEIVDPDDHHLYISLGCAAENLIVAAKANGRSADPVIETDRETLVRISLDNGPVADTPLYEAIPLRQSTRSEYDGQPISASEIGSLNAAAQEEGVSILIFTEASDVESILELVI